MPIVPTVPHVTSGCLGYNVWDREPMAPRTQRVGEAANNARGKEEGPRRFSVRNRSFAR